MYDRQRIQNIEMNYDIRLKMGQIRCEVRGWSLYFEKFNR